MFTLHLTPNQPYFPKGAYQSSWTSAGWTKYKVYEHRQRCGWLVSGHKCPLECGWPDAWKPFDQSQHMGWIYCWLSPLPPYHKAFYTQDSTRQSPTDVNELVPTAFDATGTVLHWPWRERWLTEILYTIDWLITAAESQWQILLMLN